MSIPPPNTPPPGGYYYNPNPGRPANNSSGCWKAFGITCGVLVLLGIIGIVVVVRTTGGLFRQAMGVGLASQSGRVIQQAVVAYHAKNGKYPPNLTALVSDGELTDAKVLHSDQDPNPSPGHISWRYHRPPEGAPGNTPLLDLPYQISFSGRTQAGDLIINLDGTTPGQVHPMGTPPAGNGF